MLVLLIEDFAASSIGLRYGLRCRVRACVCVCVRVCVCVCVCGEGEGEVVHAVA
jgi:hypothetical protein